jgi:hypothetical protein
MDHMEQIMLRMAELHPQIPAWAKAEQMGSSIPQIELWRFSSDAVRQKHKLKRDRKSGAI